MAARAACWCLLAAVACVHGRPEPLVSSGGQVVFINATGEDMETFVNGDRVAVVPSGREVRVDRLRLGPCRVEAVGLDTGTRLRTDLVLEPERVLSWRMDASDEQRQALASLPRGSLKARNHAPEPVRVFVDGSPREMIWPGGEAEYAGIRYGRHHVRAEGVKTGLAVEEVVVVSEGVVPVFDVRPPGCFLEVRNRTARTVIVTVGEATALRLAAGASRTVGNLLPGEVPVSVRDEFFRPVFETTVVARPGEVTPVRIPDPPGVLAVVSDLDVAVTVLADGRPLGPCAARGAAEFRGLAPGATRLQALDSSGNVVARMRLEVPSQGQAVWMVRPGGAAETGLDEGAVQVVNRRPEPVRIRVDGFARGEAGPEGKRLIPALVPGPHGLEALGVRSGEVLRADLAVHPGRTATWEASASVSILAVRNLRDEPVRLLMDEDEVAVLAPSESSEVRVPAGRHRIEARGVTTLKASLHDVDLPPSARGTLDLPSPSASVTVTNRHADSLDLRVGDREAGVIGPGERVTFQDVDPGTVRLTARSLTRPLQWTVTVVLDAGQTYEWDLSP